MRRGRIVRTFVAGLATAAAFTGLAAVTSTSAGAAPANNSDIVALAQPGVLRANGQSAGGWEVTLVAGSTWAVNDTITITVADSGNSTSNVTFASKPTTVAESDGNGTITFNTSVSGDVYTLQFTSASTGTLGIAHTQNFFISNVVYNVAAAAAPNAVVVTCDYNTTTVIPAGTTGLKTASNAVIGPVSGTLVASANPTVHPNTSSDPVGDWTATLAAGSTWASGDTLTITVKDSGGSATNVTFHEPANSPTVTVQPVSANSGNAPTAQVVTPVSGDTLTIKLGGTPTGALAAAQPISITGVYYDIAAGTPAGAVSVTDSYAQGAATTVLDSTSAGNAVVTINPSVGLTAASTPTVAVGGNGQAGGNWVLGLYTQGTGWAAGDTVDIVVGDKNKANCGGTVSAPDNIGFASAPTPSVSVGSGQSATPTVSVSTATSSTCTGVSGVKDEVVVTFTNSGTVTGTTTSAPYPVTITLSGVSYNLATGVPIGNLSVAFAYGSAPSIVTGSTTPATSGPSNATANAAFVSANSPAVAALPSSKQPISPVVVSEGVAGAVPTGYLCLTLSAGTFDSTVVPSASSGGGSALASTFSGAGTATLSFDVTTASTTATTYTFGSLLVDAPGTAQMVTVTVQDGGAAAGCATSTLVTSGLRAYATLASTRIQGPDADGTAVAEMEAQFVPGTNCPGSKSVVLATDFTYPDALAASDLAGYLGTGILLTPSSALSSETAAAIKAEGIQQVYIVGGTLAVSNAVQAQLQGTPAYNCGGTTAVTSNGAPVDLTVTRIAGQTLYDTAEQIALAVGSNSVGSMAVPGAYGLYDDVNGLESTSATTGSTAVPTAVLATGGSFQDAIAASPMAYAQDLPVLLTDSSSLSPQALQGLQSLGIQQVIVMGGPLAISDAVVQSLISDGFEVLRVAGNDATDTAQLLAQFELNAAPSGLGWGSASTFKNTVYVARGDFYSDGLAGCVVAGANKQPILLTEDPRTVGPYLAAFLNAVGAPGTSIPVLTVNALGGVQAITPSTLTQIFGDVSQG